MTRNCLSCALYRVELHVLQVNMYINSQLRNRFKPLLPWETLPCYNCHLSTCIWAFVMIYPLQTLPLPTFKYSLPTNQTIHFLLVSTRTIRGDKVFFDPAKLLSMHILVTKRKKRVFVILLTLTFGPVFQTIEYRRSPVFYLSSINSVYTRVASRHRDHNSATCNALFTFYSVLFYIISKNNVYRF